MEKELFNQLVSLSQSTHLSAYQLGRTFAVEIPKWIHDQMLADRSRFSSSLGPLTFIDSEINLSTFLSAISSSRGFRIFPGLDKTGTPKIFTMMGSAYLSNDPTENPAFYLFRDPTYDNATIPRTVGSSAALPYLQAYYDYIEIDNTPQSEMTDPKKSRFYFNAEFEKYIMNLMLPLDLYYVRLETGYITSDLSRYVLASLYPAEFPPMGSASYSPYYHMGFTCMFTVYDYATNTPLARTLEIGHPCPPQCGTLTWV